MACNELKIDVAITGLDVPLMIIVDKHQKVTVYQHGVKANFVRSVDFSARIDEVPTIKMEQAAL